MGLRKEPAALMQDDRCVFGLSLSGSEALQEVGKRKSLSELVFSLSTKQEEKRVAVVVVGYQFSRKAT